MKIVVIGGSGLIGTKLVRNLRNQGHDAVSASPRTGVNAVTGEGLDAALAGVDVVVDVSNYPSFADEAVMEFFTKSGRHLAAAEAKAGIKHHVALSVVGAERIPDSGYMRAKVAQEELICASGIPFTILRATQFFEFLDAIATFGETADGIHLPPADFQPVAAEDVAAALASLALGAPQNRIVDLAGPERMGMDAMIRRHLALRGDSRRVVTDDGATYYGSRLQPGALVPTGESLLGLLKHATWLEQNTVAAVN
jgi:uncharacterized protein YbjT (DUF2867 family)